MITDINFMPWVNWHDLMADLAMKKTLRTPGVYLLAHYYKPPAIVDSTATEICYIGETLELAKRFRQFRRAVKDGESNHAGGRTYHKKHGKTIPPNLYVSACPFNMNCFDTRGECKKFIERVESKLLWGYIDKHDDKPDCNTKPPLHSREEVANLPDVMRF